MLLAVPHLPAAGDLTALFRVALFDLPLACGRAVAIGLSDAGPPGNQRRRAPSWIAELLKLRRLGFVGLAGAWSGALHMIWEGHRSVAVDLGRVGAYNAPLPASLAITPDEVVAQYARRN
ncbi:MAG: hypothetical protein Q8K11_08395 [Phenylobacterium sp.]|uniref:hypothetical protein n=1 Tax=Phenylobacterium sp. TaxID=1871053 RepID=UPI00272FD49F|nr:hypothetical protein [Phenylobacterium sp.]MDP2010184.1 hypothetical protein [Phenylobacterium sp.]